MNAQRSYLAAAIALESVLFAGTASGQEAQTRLTPSDIAESAKGGAGAGTSGVSGIRTTVLSGNPAMPGPYTIEIRVPAHTRIAAHTHRDDRSAVVVSGRWYFGYGRKTDDALTKALGPGSFYTEPSNAAHFAITRDEPAIVYITGVGPTDTKYVDSNLDPRAARPVVQHTGKRP